MTSTAAQNLNQLFVDLYSWRKAHDTLSENCSCDQLALICLKIISLLVDDQQLGKTIAKHLSLIFDAKKDHDAEFEIRGSLIAIDEGLEANLRGFSGLLNWVLQEDVIRRDGRAILSNVPDVDPPIIAHFNQLLLAIEAYFELDDAFSLKAPKVAVAMFLTTLSEIYGELIYDERNGKAEVIIRWLTERVKNDSLKRLFEISLQKTDWRSVTLNSIDDAKELLISFICFRVARCEVIKSDEVHELDRALHSVGMLGLEPLLDSGFLALEGSNPHEDTIENNTAKILRVK